jgi:filamentous hemagglutinin family protein
MNRCYRLVFNRARQVFVVASEVSRARGKSGRTVHTRPLVWLAALPLSLSPMLGMAATPVAISHAMPMPRMALPTPPVATPIVSSTASPSEGQVTAGSGNISQSGLTTTVDQHSQNLSLNWQSFNIGADSTVNFVQPNAQSVAVNRIADANGSVILGRLNANGQVFLINPNGVLFGQGAQVNVGGLVASTLDIDDGQLAGGTRHFGGNDSGRGSVVNRGTINAAKGGYVALLGPQVTNHGTLNAPGGTVALAGGHAVTLSFDGNRLLSLQVDKSTLNALADNRQLIVANGGQVLMSAGAKDSLLASVVNNSGTIQAQTVENRAGKIVLLGGMGAGTTQVAGTLDASAPAGGNGGFIETSAAHVQVQDSARITTAAAQGKTGTWLIDPTDYTIAASGGDITGAALSANLGTSDITILSSAGMHGGTRGDVNVNDSVTWSANKLTLNAQNNININTAMHGSGNASLALEYGQGAMAAGNTSTVHVRAPVNLPAGDNFSTRQGLNGVVVNYRVITSLGGAGSVTGTDLQGINGNLNANYVLGSNIDASATAGWNAGAGFVPITGYVTVPDNGPMCPQMCTQTQTLPFTGIFDGLGHTISNLTVNRPTESNIGLFGIIQSGAAVRNLGLVGGGISGKSQVGGLAGQNKGAISNDYATANINGRSSVGGLAGSNGGTISSSHATGDINDVTSIDVGVISSIGGLVGFNNAVIDNSYSTGNVNGTNYMGGLVGSNETGGMVSNSYATGNVVDDYNYRGNYYNGGLVGFNTAQISTSYASGSVIDNIYNGGLVGLSAGGGTVTNSYWNSTTNTRGIGENNNAATATGLNAAQMQIASNFAGFNFTSIPGAAGNNWVMVDGDGSLNNAGGAAGATRPMLASEYSTTINNAHQLQLMAMGLGASYTLGQNIDAGATGTSSDVWARASFIPVGKDNARFLGVLDGQSHAIADLIINANLLTGRPSPDFVGLFGVTGAGSILRNVGLVGGSVTGQYAGALAGQNSGTVSNSYAAVDVIGTKVAGGLVYGNIGTIDRSYATGTVSGVAAAGGLAGVNYGNRPEDNPDSIPGDAIGMISNSYATGNVSGSTLVGGLVGTNQAAATIRNSYATGEVTATGGNVGGLAGANEYIITNSYATGSVTSSGNNVGGLVGKNTGGSTSLVFSRGGAISNSYASGAVSGNDQVGGLVGTNGEAGQITAGTSHSITNSYATGTVSGHNHVGGLAGANIGDRGGYGEDGGDAAGTTGARSVITNSYATGTVTSTGDYSGGLVGLNQGGQGGTGGMAEMDGVDGGNGGVGGAAVVVDSYASGLVTGLGHTGSLIGSSLQGEVGDPGWIDMGGIPGQGGAGGQATQTGSASLDATAMMQLASFSSWNDASPNTIANTGDSGAVWRIYEGHTAPLLISFMTGLTLAGAPDVAVTYNGSAQSGSSIGAPSGVLGAAATGTDAGFYNGYYSTQQGYDITGGNLTINAVALNAISLDGTRAYDGTTDVAAGIFTLSGMVGGEDLKLTGVGTIASKNVGTYNVNLGTLTLGDGSTGLASNYTFVGGTQTATITKADLLVAGLIGVNRIYDATTSAVLSGTGTLAKFGTDDVTLAGTAVGSFADKNAGINKAITVSGISLAGADAGNYQLIQPTGLSANVDKASLVVTGGTAGNRTYDGTATAAISGATISAFGADAVSLTNATSGSFADKNVGIGKAVSMTAGLTGADAGNYTLVQQTGMSANVDQASLVVTGATASNRTYDGTTTAAITGATITALGADSVSLTNATSGGFADKNIGIGKAVSMTAGLTGADAGNYTLVQQTGMSANVTPATLTYRATPAFFWNGQVPGDLNGAVTGLVGGDTLTDATAGVLTWSTPATSASPAGQYAIEGGGLSARNYVFAQAPGNALALRVSHSSAPFVVSNVVAGLQQDDETAPGGNSGASTPHAPDVRIVGSGVRLP